MRRRIRTTPLVVEASVEKVEVKSRALHRETRPCQLPGCFITWVPAARPLCDFHWLLVPWHIRAEWDTVYRRKYLKRRAGALANLLAYLLSNFEQDSVGMPEGHKYVWDAAWRCECVACEMVRKRAKRIALSLFPEVEVQKPELGRAT